MSDDADSSIAAHAAMPGMHRDAQVVSGPSADFILEITCPDEDMLPAGKVGM